METITLFSGRTMVCYPKSEQPETLIDDSLRLDTTGVYLRIGKSTKSVQTKPEEDPAKTAFLSNAFFLFDHSDEILSDSRMFLAPLPINNNLAYTGTSGFQNPTLGVYIEFWQHMGMPMTFSVGYLFFRKEVKALLYHIAGSPLSGSNSCAFVTEEGKSIQRSLSSFFNYWPPFMEINNHYTQAKQLYQSYTIQEVIEKLRS